MSVDLVVRARRAVIGGDLRPASVLVDAGRIVGIAAHDGDATARAEVLLTDDEVLLPGLVDTHVHVNEPGRTEWEGFATATRAAAAGGVTTIIDMPLNSVPPTTTVPALEVKRAAARGQCAVDVGFWGGAVPGGGADLVPLVEAGAFGAKCFLLDSGVEEFPPLDAAGLRAAMESLARVDAVLLVHAEDAGVLAAAPAAGGPAYADFLASRPPGAEVAATEVVVDAARMTGARVHVVHLSAADALPLLTAARADGVRVSAETCPHYLALCAEDVPAGATEYKCCPPVRGKENREQLWLALAAGIIDSVVSDHSPCPPSLKAGGDFATAWGGISSVQLGLPVVWTQARRRGHDLVDVVRWMARGPARLADLQCKGDIAIGYDGDLVVFAPEEEFTVDAGALHHRHPVTPYAGRRLAGVVRQTFLRGRRVDPHGAPSGRLLSRGAA